MQKLGSGDKGRETGSLPVGEGQTLRPLDCLVSGGETGPPCISLRTETLKFGQYRQATGTAAYLGTPFIRTRDQTFAPCQ